MPPLLGINSARRRPTIRLDCRVAAFAALALCIVLLISFANSRQRPSIEVGRVTPRRWLYAPVTQDERDRNVIEEQHTHLKTEHVRSASELTRLEAFGAVSSWPVQIKDAPSADTNLDKDLQLVVELL
jgi:hypothetical protein